jgi:hypothetical protein
LKGTDMTEPTPTYCRTCRAALNTRTAPGGPVTYLHAAEVRGGASDHLADPVALAELANPVMRCDFCSTDNPQWVYVGADQRTNVDIVTGRVVGAGDYRNRHQAARVLRTETAPGITQAWGTRWATCAECAPFLDSRDVYGLIGRVVAAMPAKYTRGSRLVRVRAQLHATYSGLLANLQPGRGRITTEHPLGLWEPPPSAL